MSSDRLIYLPLGGAGEIGMNAYVYGYGPKGRERLILVDCGVTFPDMDSSPGVDLIMADMAWLRHHRKRLEAIFITHAHEDHVGALGMLWGALGVPVHARRFTAMHARLKLEEHGQDYNAVQVARPFPEAVEAGPFRVAFLPVSHSIPESSALVIETPAGKVIHTGDFKLDPTPLVGEAWNPDLWAQAAAGGVQALVSDSTNVFSEHPGRSEASLRAPLTELIRGASGMVAATTFASNVARLKTLAEAGRDAGRSIVLLGRAMQRMVRTAEEAGVLSGFPNTIPPEEARDVPREQLMLIVTGSQGERRAASAQLSQGRFQGLELKEGDLFLFSSKTIPGNERGVIRVMNAYSEMGVDVVSEDDRYHVSGHANRPDLLAVHDLMRPRMVVPMHGEHRHLREHARLAEASGIPAVVAPNGSMVDLTGERPQVVEHVETGRIYRDGSVLIGALDGIVRDRIRLALNGHLTVGVVVDESDEPIEEPWVAAMGLPEAGPTGTPLIDAVEDAVAAVLGRADRRLLTSDEKLERELARAAKQAAFETIGRKPEVSVIVSRLEA